jgi:uncharacterized protein
LRQLHYLSTANSLTEAFSGLVWPTVMKFSQFNSFVPFEENRALFNALYQKVIFIEPSLESLLKAAIAGGIDGLKFQHPSFYNFLIEQQFIVDDFTDEIGAVKRLVEQIDGDQSSFFLMINPNMTCNFKCYYCYETHINKSRMSPAVADKVKKFISNTVDKTSIETFRLAFFGGEPLLYFKKDVAPIIDWYVTKCRSKGLSPSISFTSNGFLADQDLVDFFQARNLSCSFQITFDGFADQHDQVRFNSGGRGSYSKIIENVRLLIRNGFFVRARINYTDENLARAYLVAKDLCDLEEHLKRDFVLFDFHRVWQNYTGADVSALLKENINKVLSYGFEVSNSYAMDNVAQSCYADKMNSAVINYNGDLFKCTARDFLHAKREGFIDEEGELVWENGSLERRMDSKFKNPPCLKCRILPLCNGGCSQHAVEGSEREYCIFNGVGTEKDKVVESKIREIMHRTRGLQSAAENL